MRQSIVRAVLVAGLITAGAIEAGADISFSLNQGSIQPNENLLFGGLSLLDNATTVQGATNETSTIYNISSNEVLVTPTSGQARIAAADGLFDLLFLRTADPEGFFTEFEANLIAHDTGGTATVVACNQLGGFADSPPFSATGAIAEGGPCESFTLALANGENFFVLTTSEGDLLRGVRVETTNNAFVDMRQIRIGGSQVGTNAVTPAAVPEPGTLILLSSGLIVGARAFHKWRRSPTSPLALDS
jgi:hypothetical protein